MNSKARAFVLVLIVVAIASVVIGVALVEIVNDPYFLMEVAR
jgi:hypothetical protein